MVSKMVAIQEIFEILHIIKHHKSVCKYVNYDNLLSLLFKLLQ